MVYIVTKLIKGRRYRYLQRSWRQGKKVRTESKYLGLDSDPEFLRGMAAAEREDRKFDEWQRKTFGESGKERAEREAREKIDGLHEAFGLKMPSHSGAA